MITDSKVFPIEQVRAEFPILEKRIHGHPFIYFDSAATCHKPKKVIERISHFYAHEYATVNRGVYTLCQEATAKYYDVRDKVAQFIDANVAEEIVFTAGTTEGINLVATSFVESFLKTGDEVVILSTEHHANLVPWQFAKRRFGIELKIVSIDKSGELDIESFKKALSSKTKLVSIAHICNTTGAIYPLDHILAYCRSLGIYTLVDAAQSVGHMPISVKDWGCDFCVFSSHKMYGPTGLGVLFGKSELLDKMLPWQGGGDMIENVSFFKTSFAKAPLKFEAGTPKIAQVIGLGAAIDFLQDIGLDTIHIYEQGLLDYLHRELDQYPQVQRLGCPENQAGIISFALKGSHPLDVATLLDLKGIAVRSGHMCAQPALESWAHKSLLRVSLGIYNTIEEVSQLSQTLGSDNFGGLAVN